MRYLALFFLCLSSPLAAEVWLCDQNVYTNIQGAAADCTPLRNQVVCGLEGNKYYSPFRPGTRDSKSCETTPTEAGQSGSPLVNMKFVEAYRGYKPAPTKKFADKAPAADPLAEDTKIPGLGNLPDVLRMIQDTGIQIDSAMR